MSPSQDEGTSRKTASRLESVSPMMLRFLKEKEKDGPFRGVQRESAERKEDVACIGSWMDNWKRNSARRRSYERQG